MWVFWLIAAGIFFVAEIATVGFLIFWLGIGAVLAMIVSFFTTNLVIQTITFVLSSIILIIFTKPILSKYINTKSPVLTNSYSLLNKRGIVVSDINGIDSIGQVKVNGDIWSAKCEDDIIIPKGTKVEILKIDGVKLIIKPLEEYTKI